MTITVIITNDNDPTSISEAKLIEVIGGAGDKHILAPGRSVSTHVWIGTEIKITELSVTGERRAGADGYGARPPN